MATKCTSLLLENYLTLTGNNKTETANRQLLSLNATDLAIVLSSDWLCDSSEVDIFRLILKWHENRKSLNETMNGKLVNSIRWPLMEDLSQLFEKEKKSDIFKHISKMNEKRNLIDNKYDRRTHARKNCKQK